MIHRGLHACRSFTLGMAVAVLLCAAGCHDNNQPRPGGADSSAARANRKVAESAAAEAARAAANHQVAIYPELKRKNAFERAADQVKGWKGFEPAVAVSTFAPPEISPEPALPGMPPMLGVSTKAGPPKKNAASPAVISERVASEIPYPTEAEADAQALETARKLIEQRLRELDPPVEYKPELSVVKNEYVRRDSRQVRLPTEPEKALLAQNGYESDRKYVEYTVEVTADQVRELRTRNRVADSLRGLGTLVAVALAGFLFLRLDDWSRGYLTSWLGLAAAALGGGIVAAMLFV